MLANVNILKNLLVYARLRFVAVWQKMEKRGKAKWKKKKRKIITKRELLLADVCYLQGFLLKPRLSLMLLFPAAGC